MSFFLFDFDVEMKGLHEKIFSNTSDIDVEDITKPMEKMLNKEEVSEEDVEQCNQDTEKSIKQTAQKFVDAAVEGTKVHVNDSPEEKKAKVTYFVKVKQLLNRMFNWLLKLMKECFDKIRSSCIGNAISSVYYYFREKVSQFVAYFRGKSDNDSESSEQQRESDSVV